MEIDRGGWVDAKLCKIEETGDIHVTFIILIIQNPNTSIISFLSQTFHRNKGSSLVRINKTLNYEAEPSVTFFGHITHLKVLQCSVVVYQKLRKIGKFACRRGTHLKMFEDSTFS